MWMGREKKILRAARSPGLKATVQIGRSGLTSSLVEEIDRQLAQRDLVKIRCNRGLHDRDQRKKMWAEISEHVGARVVTSQGHMAVLTRLGS